LLEPVPSTQAQRDSGTGFADRPKDVRYPDALFPVWRYHPFLTNSELPTIEADIVHPRHVVIEPCSQT
jgi:hypothetical protein